MNDCVFCQIIEGKIKTKFLYEDQEVVAFASINPQARVHILVVPRRHIASVQDMREEDERLLGHMIFVAKKIAQGQGLIGYHLVFNVGSEGGQTVFHIHLHLLSPDVKQFL